MDQTKIMIVEDEKQMREMIRTFLEKDGYEVIEATDGIDALVLLDKITPDLLLVDVMMPYLDGFEFAKEVNTKSTLPFIFLTAKGEEWDKVHGLKIGGDDYIVKPFMPQELLARIESVLRRVYGSKENSSVTTIGPLIINTQSHQVTLDGVPLSLTRKEFNLLHILSQNSPRVYSREQLLLLIWGDSHQSSERTVDTHIKTLRLKMGPHGRLVETVWGVGYKFEVEA